MSESSAVPASAAGLPVLRLKPREERRLQAGHLWVFSNEVDVTATPLAAFEPGQPARLHSSRDRFLGYVHVNPHSLIAARIVGREAAHPPGIPLLVHRLKIALALREKLYAKPFYRLAFGESDLLPGLVVDRYGDVLIAQLATAGMEAAKQQVLEALERVIGPRGVLWKNDSPSRQLEGLSSYVETATGTVPDEVEVEEGGVRFRLPLAAGQKTGWFFDQTENRAAVARQARGARVLDVFSYAGGFGLQAARAGAREVVCVDASQAALHAARATAWPRRMISSAVWKSSSRLSSGSGDMELLSSGSPGKGARAAPPRRGTPALGPGIADVSRADRPRPIPPRASERRPRR